jgi:hypothetical protein
VAGSAQFGVTGGLAGLLGGTIVSAVALFAILGSEALPQPRASENRSAIRRATRFPFIDCIWGPLTLLAAAGIYTVVSVIVSKSPTVPPLIYDIVSAIIPERYLGAADLKQSDTARVNAGIAMIWLVVALLSFVVRLAQSIAVALMAGDRAAP